MKKLRHFSKIYISLTLILLLLSPALASSEFKWVNKSRGMASYEFTTLYIDKNNPDIIYAGAKGALLKTTDGGSSWKNIFKVPGPNNAVNCIAVNPEDPKIMYLATEVGVFKSADGGIRWSNASMNIGTYNVPYILIDIDDPEILFAMTERSVYKSGDSGNTWMKSADGISAKRIGSIAQNPLDPKALFVSSGAGLFKSEDRGKTWEKVFFSAGAGEADPFEEYAVDTEDYKRPSDYIAVDSVDPSVLYLATKNGFFKSKDNGVSWQRLSKSGLPKSAINNFLASPYKNDCLFTATGRGILRFSAEKNAWEELTNGLIERKINFVALNAAENSLWIATKGGIFRSEGDIYQMDKGAAGSDIEAILGNFRNEPTFRQVQEAAIEYAEVHPDKIARWRRAAKMKALFPTLSFGVDKDSNRGLHWDSGTNPDTLVIGPDDESTGWDIRCSWDLGNLIWNDDQTSIDTRSKLMVELRNDIIDEATRLYFERRRLQVELMQNPPKDPNKRIEKELRVQELTANLDGITGGYFSRKMETP